MQAAGQGFSTPRRQVIQRPNNLQTPTAQDLLQADRRCYNYGKKGHYANQCPNTCTRANQPATATPAPTRGANSVPVAAKQNYAHERVNLVAMEET
jgi:hypothetical protein